MSKSFDELMKEEMESKQRYGRWTQTPIQPTIQTPIQQVPWYLPQKVRQVVPPQSDSLSIVKMDLLLEEVTIYSANSSKEEDNIQIYNLKVQLKDKKITHVDFLKGVFALRDRSGFDAFISSVSPDMKDLVLKCVTTDTTNQERRRMFREEPRLIPIIKQFIELRKKKFNEMGIQSESHMEPSHGEAKIRSMMNEVDLSPHLTYLCQRYHDVSTSDEERTTMLLDYRELAPILDIFTKNGWSASLKQKREENDIGDNSAKRRKSGTDTDLADSTMDPDVTVVVQDSVFHLNRKLLAHHSDFFKVGLSVKWVGSNQQISLNSEDGEVDDVWLMELIFRLISNKDARVTCTSEITVRDVVPLLELSDKYQFHLINWIIVEWCLANMENSLKQWNDSEAHWILVISVLEERIRMISHNRRVHVCYEDVITKFRRLWKTISDFELVTFQDLMFLHQYMDCDTSSDHDFVAMTILSWVGFDFGSRIQYVDEIIKLIPFESMKPALVWSLVEIYPFLSEHKSYVQTFCLKMKPSEFQKKERKRPHPYMKTSMKTF